MTNLNADRWYSKSSSHKLLTCHEFLQIWAVAFLRAAANKYRWRVIEGHRGQALQNEYHRTRRSKVRWPRSYHNKTPSMALDMIPSVDGVYGWHREAMVDSYQLGLDVWAALVAEGKVHGTLTWGGDWDRDGDSEDERFFDGAHWQLKL